MADNAAGKDAKKADKKSKTEDAEKIESTETAEVTSTEVADFDAESSDEDKAAEDKAADEKAAEDKSADDSDDDDEDLSLEPDDEEAENPKRMTGRHWALTAAAVAVIAIAAGTAVIGRLYQEQRIEEQSSREALAAAQEFANGMINVDSTKLDESSNKTLDRSTGNFKQQYAESSSTLRQVMIENKAKASGVVVDSAVKTATPDRVEVLLFIDQAVSNVAIPDARMDRSRVQITMQKVDGRWLASDVELA